MKFSIVTTSFNSGEYIAEAIASVLAQDGVGPVEHVVADAQSTDRTNEILAGFPHLRIDCRKDLGIYDGMNRALGMATGDIIGIVNADDRLLPGALAAVKDVFAANDADIVSGAYQLMDAAGKVAPLNHAPTGPPSYKGLLFGVPAINARFFRRDVFARLGLFDLNFPLAADRVILLRALQARLRFAATPQPVYVYREHAGSATLSGTPESAERLWQAHIDMARRLLDEDNVRRDPELVAALKRFSTLESTKLKVARLVGTSGSKGGQGRIANGLDLGLSLLREPLRAASALLTWRRLRGTHSDSGA